MADKHRFTIMLTAVVVLATVRPAQGVFADFFDGPTQAGIVLLLFLHGARHSRRARIS